MSSRPLALALLLFLSGCGDETAPTDGGGTDAATGSDSGGPVIATEPVLPSVTGTCPDFFSGETITVDPAGTSPRDLLVYITDAANDLAA